MAKYIPVPVNAYGKKLWLSHYECIFYITMCEYLKDKVWVDQGVLCSELDHKWKINKKLWQGLYLKIFLLKLQHVEGNFRPQAYLWRITPKGRKFCEDAKKIVKYNIALIKQKANKKQKTKQLEVDTTPGDEYDEYYDDSSESG